MNNSENKTLLEKLNKFTRREFLEDDVYIFPVTLCDNDIDRDNERFSRKSLETLAEKFIGVTGILDHDPKGRNQIARIFATEVVKEDRFTETGEPYAYLKGYAYMVRTDKNTDLIREIDGGIKKEVSISCSANRQVCSVCGTDKHTNACCHIKGCTYDDKRCFVTLEDIFDVYEWSFVVPQTTHSKGIKMPVKPMTNFERIKAMNTDELAAFLVRVNCAYSEDCMVGISDCKHRVDGGCRLCFKEWLESEVKQNEENS